jgi:hypothetical protein
VTEKLTDALYEEALARVADGNIDVSRIGLRRWCDGSGPCAVETEPHGHWRGGVSVSTREVVLRLVRERDEARAALADIARGDYSDPLCQRTPEQRARDALARSGET